MTQEFLELVKILDPMKVKAVVESGTVDINFLGTRHYFSHTALTIALCNLDSTTALYLLKKGALINVGEANALIAGFGTYPDNLTLLKKILIKADCINPMVTPNNHMDPKFNHNANTDLITYVKQKFSSPHHNTLLTNLYKLWLLEAVFRGERHIMILLSFELRKLDLATFVIWPTVKDLSDYIADMQFEQNKYLKFEEGIAELAQFRPELKNESSSSQLKKIIQSVHFQLRKIALPKELESFIEKPPRANLIALFSELQSLLYKELSLPHLPLVDTDGDFSPYDESAQQQIIALQNPLNLGKYLERNDVDILIDLSKSASDFDKSAAAALLAQIILYYADEPTTDVDGKVAPLLSKQQCDTAIRVIKQTYTLNVTEQMLLACQRGSKTNNQELVEKVEILTEQVEQQNIKLDALATQNIALVKQVEQQTASLQQLQTMLGMLMKQLPTSSQEQDSGKDPCSTREQGTLFGFAPKS